MKIVRVPENLGQIVEVIKEGGVVICPTDTIYGLIADASNEKAVKKVLMIKKRDSKPIPIFVKDIKMAGKLAQIDKKKQRILAKVWPGKITVVLKKKRGCKLPKILFGSVKTIGLRIPDHGLINVLLKKLDRPLTGTSANISGKPGSNKIKKVIVQFKNEMFQPDLVVDAGDLELSKPSTVVDLTESSVKILRR